MQVQTFEQLCVRSTKANKSYKCAASEAEETKILEMGSFYFSRKERISSTLSFVCICISPFIAYYIQYILEIKIVPFSRQLRTAKILLHR